STGLSTCARRSDNSVSCWGYNSGNLGDGTMTDRHTPVSVSSLTTAVEVSTGTGVSASDSFSCARRSNGAVSCWGPNAYGNLGDGTRTAHNTPGPVTGPP